MRICPSLACLCLVVVGMMSATDANAKVFRCKDATGATIFSGTPCGGNAQELNVAMIGTDREVRQRAPAVDSQRIRSEQSMAMSTRGPRSNTASTATPPTNPRG